MSADVVMQWRDRMRRGDFEAAWRISDRVLRGKTPGHNKYLPVGREALWNGEPLAGRTVLISCNHGLGDTIQFVRYLPLVRRTARRVILHVQAPLAILCETLEGVDEIVTRYNGIASEKYDVAVEVMELPHIFRATLGSIPVAVPYLHVNPRRLTAHGNIGVGIVWRAGDWDARRSIPTKCLTMLSNVPGITWHILQRGCGWDSAGLEFGVDSSSNSLVEAARTIAGLDLMITVDSMPAHLAGALGVSTWTLLHADSDWRWLTRRDDSPWYPTMRLFRQEQPGDWQQVIERVAVALTGFVADRRSSVLAAA